MKFFIANYEKGVDTDGNGKINSDEAEAITVLDVSCNISAHRLPFLILAKYQQIVYI
jgi:hypothetical protein